MLAWRACRVCLLAGLAASVGSAGAVPYIPADGAQIIERLPRRSDPQQLRLQRLRQQLSAAPGNLPVAVTLAQAYIETSRREGDPRYQGYAQAVLMPWWDQNNPPVPVRMLRATLRQSMHQFASALRDLDALLKIDGGNAQAWLTRATVLQVQGRYQDARASCARLFRLTDPLVAQTCMYGVASLNGEAAPSYAALRLALRSHADAEPVIRVWTLTVLADMAMRLGQMEAAEASYRQALALDAADSYLLAAYADCLLEQGRAPEVRSLLDGKLRIDALLLRYALALQALNAPATRDQIALLQTRFDAAARRGDTVHLREQSRFELELMKRPERALQLAQQNWAVQREPADAQILLAAAGAAHDRAAAEPVLAWLKVSRLEDRQVARRVQALGAAR